MKSELGLWLDALKFMAEKSGRTEDITRDLGISVATLRRWIKELRHLGAKIVPVRESGAKTGSWAYRVENWQEIEPMVTKWIGLEEARERVFTPEGIAGRK